MARNLVKVLLSHEDGIYSYRRLTEEEAAAYQRLHLEVVEVTEARIAKWDQICAQFQEMQLELRVLEDAWWDDDERHILEKG